MFFVDIGHILDLYLCGGASRHNKVTIRVLKPQLNLGQPLQDVSYLC